MALLSKIRNRSGLLLILIGFALLAFVVQDLFSNGFKSISKDVGSVNGKDIAFDSCKVGDVIVFTGTNAKNRRAGHVGIIVSKLGEEMQFIHSSSNKKNGGVKLSTFKESPYYKVRFLKIIRITEVR